MEENTNSPTEVILSDSVELEKSIEQLVEVIEQDFAIREQEKNDLAAKEKKEQEEFLLKEKQELTEVKKNEESILETQTFESEYKETLLSTQETQVDSMELLIAEMQTLNSNTVLHLEILENQNDLIIEASLTLVITIVVVSAVKIFLDQITKW